MYARDNSCCVISGNIVYAKDLTTQTIVKGDNKKNQELKGKARPKLGGQHLNSCNTHVPDFDAFVKVIFLVILQLMKKEFSEESQPKQGSQLGRPASQMKLFRKKKEKKGFKKVESEEKKGFKKVESKKKVEEKSESSYDFEEKDDQFESQ